jgi:hypothetical protein
MAFTREVEAMVLKVMEEYHYRTPRDWDEEKTDRFRAVNRRQKDDGTLQALLGQG